MLKPEDFLQLPLNNEAELCLPLSTFADAKGSLAHPHAYPAYPAVKQHYNLSSRLVREGIIIIAWNVIRHYYPQLKATKIDWQAALPDYLQRAATCKSEDEFTALLNEFMATIRDGQ